MKHKILNVIIGLLLFTNSFCQLAKKNTPISFDHESFFYVGMNSGKYIFPEFGYCFSAVTIDPDHPFSYTIFVGNEFKLSSNFFIGPKIGSWITLQHFAAGISIIDYSDLHADKLVFRPEAGMEFKRFKFTYGYNLRMGNNTLLNFNSHLLNLVYTLRRRLFLSKRLI